MSPERRLLVVTESLGVGGTESHLIRVLPRLAARGWKVAIFCLSERGKRAQQIEAAGVEVFARSQLAIHKKSLLYPAHIALASGKLFSLMRRWRPDIAHFYLPGPYLVGALLAIATHTPIKIMSRRSLSRYQQNWPTVGRMERFLHGRMDVLIGNSRAVVGELMAEGVPETKVRLIYNGIEVAEPLLDQSEARRELGLDQDALVGVVVANLIHYKGHRELIKGLAQIAQHLPSPWRILLAGRDYGLRAELEALAEERGIAGNLQFLGERSDVSRLLVAADFGLLTSREEGFSNVILEGMAAGLPMIVTAVGGNPEAVLDERTGLVVSPNDPKAIGEAVLRLARAPDLQKRFGAAGRSRVEQEFSIDRCVAAYEELYEELLAKVQARSESVTARKIVTAEDRGATGIKVLLLTRYARKGPSSRVRFMQFCEGLAERGIEVDVAPLLLDPYLQRRYARKIPNLGSILLGYLQRLNKLAHVKQYDLIWLEKEALPGLPAFCELPFLRRRPLILDVDDAWYLRYSASRNPLRRFILGGKLETIARHATVVIVANEFLRRWAEVSGADSVQLIPTVVDLQRYPFTPAPAMPPFTVGWIGTPTSSVYLEQVRGALQRALSRPDSRLLVIGLDNFSLPGVHVEVHPWSEDRESQLLQQIHVGIMPLDCGLWAHGKSAYKAIQYMATGRPVVASPVGACLDVVIEGVTGFLAADEDGWVTAIETLRNDPLLASKLGRAGRQRVEQSYSRESQLPTLATILKSAASGKHISRLGARQSATGL